MNPDSVCALWERYRRTDVDRTIHPDDDMYKKSVNGWADYSEIVGVSAARAILSVLPHMPTESIGSILDLACGHGRVARHLRAMFPGAELYFSDLDSTGSEFCSKQFDGRQIESKEDFSALELPDVDLIWVGSLFTHLDAAQMIRLWDRLFEALTHGGALIATFRGRTMYRLMQEKPDAPFWKSLFDQYLSCGIGYQDYPPGAAGGLSLSTIAACTGLAKRQPKARLIGYTEAGWANVHDVASWTKTE